MAGAERAASVKLSLDSGEYLVELRRVGNENKKVADEGKRRFDAMGKGIDSAKKSMTGMFASAKDGIRTLATLGGAFTAANAAKQAVDLDAKFRMLAHRATDASQALVKTSDVQNDVARSAAKTSRTSQEMVTVFEDLLGATGDLDFTREMLATIGTTATGTGRSLASLTTLGDQLHTKFGITAEAMAEAFARVEDHASRGGPTFDEFSQAASTLGDDLLEAGLKGEQGLDFLLGALVKTDDEMQDFGSQVGGIKKLLLNLGKGSEIKAIAKDLAIDPAKLVNEKDSIARLMKILSFGKKGLDSLKANFVGPEERKALRILFTDPFEQALNRAKAVGLKGKDAVDQALTVLEGQIEEFGESNLNAAEVQKRASKEMESPQANLRKALERLETAFGQPEIIQAIDQLSKSLPDIARIFAGFVTFAAKNPLLAGALGIGGNVGASFLSGMAKELLAKHLAGGKGAAAALQGGVVSGAKTGSGLLAGAGAAFGIAAAASMAYGAGKAAIDSHFDDQGDASRNLANATFAGNKPKNAKERDAQIAKLEASIAATKGQGEGFLDNVFRGGARIASAVSGNGFMSPPDSRVGAENARREAREKIAKLKGMRFGETTVEQMPGAPSKSGRVSLDAGAARQIGVGVRDALGGQTLNVRIVSGPGVPASAGRYGGRGPIAAPAASSGGGV